MPIINNPHQIASECTYLNLNTSGGIDVKFSGQPTTSGLTPNILLEFDRDFEYKDYSIGFLQDYATYYFKEYCYCGNGIQFGSGPGAVLITNGPNEYNPATNTIKISKKLDNPNIFLHEIIHSLIENNGTNYWKHNTRNSLCSLLDIYTNGSPGLLLDIVNRLEMHFSPSTLGAIHHKKYYLATNIYPSLIGYCNKLSSSLEEGKKININDKKIRREEKIKEIDQKDFLKYKFGDEYDFMKKNIKSFPRGITKSNYIENNIETFKSKNNLCKDR